jgi:hypothetical protein
VVFEKDVEVGVDASKGININNTLYISSVFKCYLMNWLWNSYLSKLFRIRADPVLQ